MFAFPIGWGTLGFALPAAIGAATSGRRTVCVIGDGGFLFACGELATIAQERLPVTIVIVDDGGYGMLRFDQRQAGHPASGVDLATPNFLRLADAFGIPAEGVVDFGPSFERQLAAALKADGPNLIVVEAELRPPPTVSMRWYRQGRG